MQQPVLQGRRGLAQELARLAPELPAQAGHAGQVQQIRVARPAHLGGLDARQPFAIERVHAGFQHVDQLDAQLVAQFGAGLQHALPRRQEPGTGQRRIAMKAHQPGGRVHAQLGHGALAVVQQRPGLLQLHRVMGIVEQFKRQAAQDALRGSGRERAVLGQQARGFQRLQGLPSVPGGAQLHAQGQRAARRALRQLAEPVEGGAGIMVFEGPAGSAKQHAFAHFLGMAGGRILQGEFQVLVAQGLVLQRLRAFGHQQMRQRAQLAGQAVAVTGGVPGRFRRHAQAFFLRQRIVGRFGRADEASSHQVGQRIHERAVHGTFLLLRTPAPRLDRQGKQRRQRARRQVQQHEQPDQQQHRQVEGNIDPVRRPENGDDGLVVAGKQGNRDGNAKQGDEPESGAHGVV